MVICCLSWRLHFPKEWWLCIIHHYIPPCPVQCLVLCSYSLNVWQRRQWRKKTWYSESGRSSVVLSALMQQLLPGTKEDASKSTRWLEGGCARDRANRRSGSSKTWESMSEDCPALGRLFLWAALYVLCNWGSSAHLINHSLKNDHNFSSLAGGQGGGLVCRPSPARLSKSFPRSYFNGNILPTCWVPGLLPYMLMKCF